MTTDGTGGKIDAGQSLEVMYHAALAVGRAEDLDQVLDRVLKLVFDWTEADRGCIMLRQNETETMQPAARCDRRRDGQPLDPEQTPAEPIAISRTILDYVLTSKQGVRTTDAQDDKRFDEARIDFAGACSRGNLRSVAGALRNCRCVCTSTPIRHQGKLSAAVRLLNSTTTICV